MDRGQVRHDVQQVVLAALIGAAIAFDESATLGQLKPCLPISARACDDAGQPGVNQSLLGLKATAQGPQPLQRSQRAQGQHAQHRVRADLERQRPRVFAPVDAGTIPLR